MGLAGGGQRGVGNRDICNSVSMKNKVKKIKYKAWVLSTYLHHTQGGHFNEISRLWPSRPVEVNLDFLSPFFLCPS